MNLLICFAIGLAGGLVLALVWKWRLKLRLNVLILVLAGYAAVTAVFFGLTVNGINDAAAADIVNGPLMALIGGSLAIAKDLLGTDIAEQKRQERTADNEHQHRDDQNGAQVS